MSLTVIAAAAASAGDLAGSWNYVRCIRNGTTRPHLFSWLVWAILMTIATGIQIHQGSLATAFTLGVATIINFTIFGLSLKTGDHKITRGDWIALIAALGTIPLWLVTENALYAAGLITLINLFACFPTFRKAWFYPQEENWQSFGAFSAIGLLRLLSISPWSLTAALYPVALLLMNAALSIMILARRRALSPLIAS